MSEPIYIFTVLLMLGTIVLVFGMKYLSAFQQARARLREDQAYRKVAEKSAAAGADSAAALISIQDALAELRLRMTAIEKILKEVE